MTTIILTIIGILLAAAAALMVIFYGGDAFNSGNIGAEANNVHNAGTNVLAAMLLYKTEKGEYPVADWPAFVASTGNGGSYLQEEPSLPSPLVQSLNANGQYVVSGVRADVCSRINLSLKNGSIAPTSSSTAKGQLCVPSATPGAPGTFYANSLRSG